MGTTASKNDQPPAAPLCLGNGRHRGASSWQICSTESKNRVLEALPVPGDWLTTSCSTYPVRSMVHFFSGRLEEASHTSTRLLLGEIATMQVDGFRVTGVKRGQDQASSWDSLRLHGFVNLKFESNDGDARYMRIDWGNKGFKCQVNTRGTDKDFKDLKRQNEEEADRQVKAAREARDARARQVAEGAGVVVGGTATVAAGTGAFCLFAKCAAEAAATAAWNASVQLAVEEAALEAAREAAKPVLYEAVKAGAAANNGVMQMAQIGEMPQAAAVLYGPATNQAAVSAAQVKVAAATTHAKVTADTAASAASTYYLSWNAFLVASSAAVLLVVSYGTYKGMAVTAEYKHQHESYEPPLPGKTLQDFRGFIAKFHPEGEIRHYDPRNRNCNHVANLIFEFFTKE